MRPTIVEKHDLSDAVGFAEAVRPYWSDMARLAHVLAPRGQWEDVLQEALSVAWRKRAQFDPARGSVRTWLVTVVADQCRKGIRRVRPTVELVDGPGEDPAPGEDLDLIRALSRLTSRQRTAVGLHYYAGLRVAEIAAAMNCSTGTVKSTLADARTRLRHELGQDYRHA